LFYPEVLGQPGTAVPERLVPSRRSGSSVLADFPKGLVDKRHIVCRIVCGGVSDVIFCFILINTVFGKALKCDRTQRTIDGAYSRRLYYGLGR